MYSDENYETFYSAMFQFTCYYKHLTTNVLFLICLYLCELYNNSILLFYCSIIDSKSGCFALQNNRFCKTRE
ncbi:4-amino-4-deoxy-L-arabinose transferase [Prevotella pallens ATCC 700821]|uniref:4-amino-4-deoxy-L-arabinose transferase n=1 Tax=Prevotella pallens ATCC 700821 TaxID=997353 RepID=F9DJ23_9BACT|nr:4-amino-4-deoxy-L-arabinose transferase [Prevotella pallens ATCC 700821]